MSIYLHDIPLPQAVEYFYKALGEAGIDGLMGIEEVPLTEKIIGRVLAEPVWARISSPHYHASAMDGFAVQSAATATAQPSAPVSLNCSSLSPEAVYLDTGDPLPVWADCVIPIENTEPVDGFGQISLEPRHPVMIRIRSAYTPWSHVRPLGEDIVATQLVLPAGHKLRPVDLGAIAACGQVAVKLARQPRVAILPTGTELVEIGTPVKPGDIIEFNSIVLAAQVNSWGGTATRMPITTDDFSAIRDRVIAAAQDHDLVLINAGSSAGSEDFSARVVESLGRLLVHGVAVRPGHPVILGMLQPDSQESPGSARQVPVIGVPGYPVSAALTGEIFVEPLLARWLGRRPATPDTLEAELTRKVTSPAGDDDFMRVAVARVGEKYLAAPLSRGAGVITSLVRADGLALLPRGIQGLQAGSKVNVSLYRSLAEIERTLIAVGSHDITLDLLAQFLARFDVRLSSANVGSLGGLIAIKRGESHFGGSHLLDPDTGEFNLSYIRQYIPGVPVRVVALVGREQGLIVVKENPKNIRGLEDLANPEVTFVNRQRGAGTRVLLDYHLTKKGIDSSEIRGYNLEEFTHLSVAAAISSGRADCGLGIAAAAKALDLDFIPLFQERYDLVIPTQFVGIPPIKSLFQVIEGKEFKQAVAHLSGYDVSNMGKLISNLE